ncbi:MAG: LacI family DNA-binding transcriptional regulator [Phocaeicola sp.]
MNKLPERIRIKDIARLADVSVGTVDRVLHGRSGVSKSSRERVEEVLKELNYQPNMYASALASNKKYKFCSLLPQYQEGGYWSFVENGINKAIQDFSDFHITLTTFYYDQFDSESFAEASRQILLEEPDGVLLSPSTLETTSKLTTELKAKEIPYVFVDSNVKELEPLAFFGQHSKQTGYFSARMAMLLGQNPKEIVIFRQLYQGVLGSNQQLNREKGFRQYMSEHFPECRIVELNFYAKRPDEDEAILQRFFNENPQIKCGITFNSKVYIVGEYLEKHNLHDFKLIGYDLIKQNVACLKNGSVDFLIAQQPTLQGYSAIETLCNHLILRKEVIATNYMPITLLTIENVDFYLHAIKK